MNRINQRLLLRLSLLALLLLGFALRLYRLDYQELRGDEAFGYFFSQRPYGEIVDATIALAEPHPVASYFAQKAWLGLAGDGEFALRFPGAWWGVLAVALLYRLGRRIGYRPLGAAAASLLLALSPYAIWHSQDARMYAMSLALTVAAVLFGLEALERRRWPWAAAYILAAALALHTHYYAVFVLVALNLFVLLWMAFARRMRPMFAPWLLWQVLVVALFLPWLVRAASILSGYSGNGDSPGLFAALQRALGVFAAGESALPGSQGVWMLIAGLLLLVGILRLALGSPRDLRNLCLLALYLGVPLLATWWGAQARPIFNERYLVAALPPFYLLIAAALDPRLVLRRVPVLTGLTALLAGALIAAMCLSLVRGYSDPAYSKTRGWRELAAAITRLSAGIPPERVRVAQNFPDPTLWYYYRGPVEHSVLPPQANDAAGARGAAQALAGADVQRVILPVQPAANWDAGSLAGMALDGWFDRAAQLQVGVWPVQVYARPPGALSPVNAEFEDGVTLRGYVAAPDTLPPGGLLTVHLDWAAAANAAEDAAAVADGRKVFVQLLDAGGQLVAQDDRPLVFSGPRAAGSGLAVYGLVLPTELGTGPYQLIAGIYDPTVDGAPRLQTRDGADHVTLRSFD